MLARNQITLTHRDSFNEPCSKNAVIPLEVFEGGHAWVQSPDGEWPRPDLSRDERGEILKWPAILTLDGYMRLLPAQEAVYSN